jgi:hypothetical protein
MHERPLLGGGLAFAAEVPPAGGAGVGGGRHEVVAGIFFLKIILVFFHLFIHFFRIFKIIF